MSQLTHDLFNGADANVPTSLKTGVKTAALPDHLANGRWRLAKDGCGRLNFLQQVFNGVLHARDHNVKNHIGQDETSHLPHSQSSNIVGAMTESDIFRENLLEAMREAGLTAAELSRKAGLNARAVKDIEEQRVQSPKLSTVFKLSAALNRDPGEMMGLGARPKIRRDLADFLSKYPEDEQQQLLAMFRLIAPHS